MKLNDLFGDNANLSNVNEKLIQVQLERASYSYYNDSESIMSDEEFDQLKDELRILNPNNPFLKQIGSKVKTTEWKKEKHNISMCSLDKVNTEEEFKKWVSDIGHQDFQLTEKLDGISINLEYKDGILIKAITRGNGIEGENILSNVLKMNNVKQKLPIYFTGSIRGEIILKTSKFNEINKIIVKNKNFYYLYIIV
jgi:DNA ligase (NAD+)